MSIFYDKTAGTMQSMKDHIKTSHGVSTLFALGASESSLHGLPRVYRSGSYVRKCVWLFIVFLGLGVMIWQVSQAVLKYLSWQTETKFAVSSRGSLPLPAITFCNINSLRSSALRNFTKDERLDKLFDKERVPDGNSTPTFSTENTVAAQLEHIISSMTLQQRIDTGYSIDDMLVDCSLNGHKCSASDFLHFPTLIYGNCYTLNTFDASTAVSDLEWKTLGQVSKIGPMYGVDLTLSVDQDEYIKLTEEAGVRVVIHNQTSVPFPENRGFSVSTGQAAYVGLKRWEYYRASPPYGDCNDYPLEHIPEVNMYTDYRQYLGYDFEACRKTCLQTRIIKECDCGDPFFPVNVTVFRNIKPGIQGCTSTEFGCIDSVLERFNDNCSSPSVCPQPCREAVHELTISTARWPSEVTEDGIIVEIARKKPAINNLPVAEQHLHVRDNYLKVKIYFDALSFFVIETKSSYSITDLLGDLGGHFGLYLGMSAITFFEFIEILLDVSMFCFGKRIPSHVEEKGNGQAT